MFKVGGPTFLQPPGQTSHRKQVAINTLVLKFWCSEKNGSSASFNFGFPFDLMMFSCHELAASLLDKDKVRVETLFVLLTHEKSLICMMCFSQKYHKIQITAKDDVEQS